MNPQEYIPKPCHEHWEAMTGDDRKKFCHKCSCSVHNLTGKSHAQIMNLKVELGGSLCGVFSLSATEKPAKKKFRRVHLKRPLFIGASISSLALAACQSDRDFKVVGKVESSHPPECEATLVKSHILMGRVSPPNEEPLKEPKIMGKIKAPE